MTLSLNNWRAIALSASAAAVALAAPGSVMAAPAASPAAAAAEAHDDFTYGPLRFRVETLALDTSRGAKVKLSIENLSHSPAHVILASVSAAQNGIGLSLTSKAGAKCEAKTGDISEIRVVTSEGEAAVKSMTPIAALARLTFSASFHCDTGQLSTADKLSIVGRILTATEAGGFDIPLNFSELTAK